MMCLGVGTKVDSGGQEPISSVLSHIIFAPTQEGFFSALSSSGNNGAVQLLKLTSNKEKENAALHIYVISDGIPRNLCPGAGLCLA